MKSRPCRFSFLSRRHIPVERQREQEKARLSPSVQDRQNMRLNGQKMQCVHSFFAFPDFRKLIYSSINVYWTRPGWSLPQKISFLKKCQRRTGWRPVSYTHLTLPTNREM